MNEIILKEEKGQVVASSNNIAEKFGKRHDQVLRDIDNMLKSDSTILWSEMFNESTYVNSRGKEYRCFLVNRDGFSLLAMGFTGKKALEWKLKYINAFNAMEEALKSGTTLSEEERLKLQLFSKDPSEVAYAHKRLVEIETAPLVAEIEEQKPKVEYHDEVLNKDGLITTTVVAKDLGYRSAQKLNEIMNLNHIIFKNQSGTWCPYAEYEWLIIEGYADYQSYTAKNAAPCLKWTEKGRKWIIENYDQWAKNITAV